MDNKKVKELRELAEEQGIKGCSRMKKAELIQALRMVRKPKIKPKKLILNSISKESTKVENELPIPKPRTGKAARPVPAPRKGKAAVRRNKNLLDETVPLIDVPILKSTPYVKKNKISSLKSLTKKAKESVNKEINKFANWISSCVPERIKVPVNKKVNSLKEKVNKIFNRIEKFTPKEHKTAIKGYLKTYRIEGQKGYDPKNFLINIKTKVVNLIDNQKKPVKVKFILTCRFIKENPATGEINENSGYFHSEVETVTEVTDLSENFNTKTERLIELIDQYTNLGSGWQFDYIESFDINIDPFEPLSGSSYIPLPEDLANKKAIINVKNENDHECFKWAVTSAVFQKNHTQKDLTMK